MPPIPVRGSGSPSPARWKTVAGSSVRELAVAGRRIARDPEPLAGDLAHCPVAQRRVAVAAHHRHVAEYPLHSLPGPRRARAGRAPDVALHRLPRLDVDLAR